jgi:transposase InsO family protein
MEAYPLPDATATTVALKLVNEFICRFGVPQELHSDRGTNFESEVFGEVCRLLGISKTRTTAYNPKSDGLVERFNKTLVNIVSVMIDPKRRQRAWDEFLPYATSAYRCTPQDPTGESPNMMMLGREVSLPIDLVTECEGF